MRERLALDGREDVSTVELTKIATDEDKAADAKPAKAPAKKPAAKPAAKKPAAKPAAKKPAAITKPAAKKSVAKQPAPKSTAAKPVEDETAATKPARHTKATAPKTPAKPQSAKTKAAETTKATEAATKAPARARAKAPAKAPAKASTKSAAAKPAARKTTRKPARPKPIVVTAPVQIARDPASDVELADAQFSAATYASAAAAAISDAATRALRRTKAVEPESRPNTITSGGVPSRRSAGGGYATPRPRADFTANEQGEISSNKETFERWRNEAPTSGIIAKQRSEIARATTGSIAKQRTVTGEVAAQRAATGAIDTITRESLKPDAVARLDALTGPIELPSERRKRIRRRIATIAVSSLLSIAVVAAALGGWAWHTVTKSFPQALGTIAVTGLQNPATIQRDKAGIATITAESPMDLFYAQGYVHAQERFWEMDVRRHVTSGSLSEMFGESQVDTDKFLRALNWHGVAQEEFDLMTPRYRSYYEAYADGVNAYLADHQGASASVEYALLGLSGIDYEPAPWEPTDSIAWLKAMAWDLRTNIEEETERSILAQQVPLEQLAEIYPDYPFESNPAIVSASSPIPGSGFVIGFTDEETTGEADGGATPTPQPAPTEPAGEDEGEADEEEAATASANGSTLAAAAESVMVKVDRLLAAYGEGIGSNSWVVSGRLTESGLPVLANDPHLGAELPSVWTQMHLRCAELSSHCPFDVAGFSFSGLPGIVIGHNQQIAWGFTNLTTDVADLYVERVTDDDQVYFDGALQSVTTREETLNVAGADPVKFTVRETSHGPIVSDFSSDFAQIASDPYVSIGDASGVESAETALPVYQTVRDANGLIGQTMPGEWAVALRWTALDAGTSPQAIFALNTATNFDEFRTAASLFNVPAQNLIYADVEGNIGYQAPGGLPIRPRGDGWLPQPGWDSSFDWEGFIEFDDHPVVYNPASGYIVTANNAIIAGADSVELTRDWDHGYRQARIVRQLDATIAAGKVTPEAMAAIQNDNYMFIGPRIANAFKHVTVPADLKPLIDDLQAWNGQNTADSADAAYANVLWNRLAMNIFAERDVPLPLGSQSRLFTIVDRMLQDPTSPYWTNEKLGISSMEEMLLTSALEARDELSELQGKDHTKWNWGELHALELRHGTIGSSGSAIGEMVLNRGPFAVGGGGSVVNATGWTVGEGFGTVTVPSMRMIVDLADFDNSTWINLTGQSGHAFHANYTDQTEDWAAGIQRPWPFSVEATDAASSTTLTLQPK